MDRRVWAHEALEFEDIGDCAEFLAAPFARNWDENAIAVEMIWMESNNGQR